MPEVMVVFGVEMPGPEAQLAITALDLVRRGHFSMAQGVITKMGELECHEGLTVLVRELDKLGEYVLATAALHAIRSR